MAAASGFRVPQSGRGKYGLRKSPRRRLARAGVGYNTRLVAEAVPRTPESVQPAETSLARRGLLGFSLSGILLALVGAILPAWGYHVREDHLEVGAFFLSMNLGLWASYAVARWALKGLETATLLAVASGISCLSLLVLALLPPGVGDFWRMVGIWGVGVGAGVLHRGVFQAISPLYERDPAATLYLAGIFFGAGCILVSLLVAGTFYVYTVGSILFWVAIIPAFYCGMYLKVKGRQGAGAGGDWPEADWRQTLAGLRNPVAVILALVLFFQFGNEWSLAGWLPLVLTKRVGVSPAASLLMLTLYWLSLLVGRVFASALLDRVPHGKLLGTSVMAALFGCVVLATTNNRFGAVSGILLVGSGFASVYPLVVERIKGRFPTYHPGSFNGIFSFAVTGGLLAPWSLGFFVDRWGAGAVIAVPLAGTLMVALLVIVLWIEARLAAYA